jgi:hypothetical protein
MGSLNRPEDLIRYYETKETLPKSFISQTYTKSICLSALLCGTILTPGDYADTSQPRTEQKLCGMQVVGDVINGTKWPNETTVTKEDIAIQLFQSRGSSTELSTKLVQCSLSHARQWARMYMGYIADTLDVCKFIILSPYDYPLLAYNMDNSDDVSIGGYV